MPKIYIVQHCQSEHHINDLTGGWTDTPLTPLGVKQAKAVAKELEALGLSKDFILFSSDLLRASMTADHISEYFGVDKIEVQALREINNGEATNKTKEWANKHRLVKNGELGFDTPHFKGAESFKDLYDRMTKFYKESLLNVKQDTVLVSHGVAGGFLIAAYMGMNIDEVEKAIFIGNAGGISILGKSYFNQNAVITINTTTHLRDL